MHDVLGEVLVARQPVVDAGLEVVGYRLTAQDAVEGSGARATATVVVDGLLALGRELLTDGEAAHLPVPVSLLLAGTLLDVPAEGIVVELGTDVADEPRVRDALASHRRAGFTLALAGLAPGDPRGGLLGAVDLVKVDSAALGEDVALPLVRELVRYGAEVVATSVERPETFDRLVGAGAVAFQGFFFTRPRAVRAVRPLGLPPTHLGLLRELALEEVDLDRVEQLIRSDLTLTDRFLRLADVAAGWREVESIRHGLVLMGTRPLHRWVTLLVMSAVTTDVPGELLTTASVRARYCEELWLRRGSRSGLDVFGLGMFSVLGPDGVVPGPVLEEIPLSPPARDALAGRPGELRDLVEAALAAERADWESLVAAGRRLGLEPGEVAAAHVQALRWSAQVRAADRAPSAPTDVPGPSRVSSPGR